MASNPSMFAPIGVVDAMTGGYFMSGGGGGAMMSTDVPHFHPSMLLEHGGFGFGFGDPAAGGAAPASDMGANFAGNSVTVASFASQLFATAPAPPLDDRVSERAPPEDMDGYGAGGGGSCVAASLQCSGGGGHSGAMAVWSSYKKPAAGTWSNAGVAPEPYHLAGIPADAAGFHYPHAAAAANAPASSELSLTLCSKSSSDGAPNAASGQCSLAASRRSALTELLPLARARPRPAAAHFSVVVARSRYAAVAQEALNEAVGHLLDGVAVTAAGSSSGVDGAGAGALSVVSSSEDSGERGRVKSDLLKLLQMMDEKYNQCLDEIQSTTAKFNALMHSGAGGAAGNGSICAPFAHRAVSALYRGLRRRIAGEIVAAASRATTAGWGGESSSSVTAASGGDAERSWKSAFIRKHWAARERRRGEQQCWRPQRGLPEKCVAVLKAWLFENFLHPYPKDHEKDVLAARSGLTRSQVSNWFINARVRLWKPMIEEMYQDLKKSSGVGGGQGPSMEPHTSKRRICELEEGQ
ncbi:unnamed protein product [Urochloa decumbens]|uniref:Homeobox domain-containing protein n=1 Tax=Urochloa decumbens TaxID=240449 RepID=A0ABC9A362_9POAL